MLLRYRGETHKQFIDRLQIKNDSLIHQIRQYEQMLEDIKNDKNILHVDKFEALVDKYNVAVEKLKQLGVWCGE